MKDLFTSIEKEKKSLFNGVGSSTKVNYNECQICHDEIKHANKEMLCSKCTISNNRGKNRF